MCTVTFIARKNGYALGMNRDEKLTRTKALLPGRHEINGHAAIFPSEPSGGTRIGVNDAGVTFALINWYSVAARVSKDAATRGKVVRSALGFDTMHAVEKHFAHFPLRQTNPFRLIGIFPQSGSVIEWRWDLSRLKRVVHEWRTNIWISSGFDEPGAQQSRRTTFLRAARNGEPQTVDWLRRLHASHEPACGPYSLCMHRSDAATISYTEIEVSPLSAQLAYSASAPCGVRTTAWRKSELRIRRAERQRVESARFSSRLCSRSTSIC